MANRAKRLPASKRSAPTRFQWFGNLKNYLGIGRQKSKVYYKKVNKTVERKPFTSFFVGLAILFLIILLGNTIFKTRTEAPTEDTTPKNVTVYRVGEAPLLTVQGEVKKKGVIKITAQAPGLVASINTVEGTVVQKGNVILSLSTNYQGGNAATVQRQLAASAYTNAKETYALQQTLMQKQRDLVERQSENSDEMKKLTQVSIDETRTLVNLNGEILRNIQTQIQNAPPGTDVSQLQAQQAQLQAGQNQLQAGLRASEYQVDSTKPPADIEKINKDIALNQLDLQQKALEFSLQSAGLQLKLAQIQEANMYPAAPFSGTVQRIHVKVGDSITPGTVLATLAGDEKGVVVDAKVPSDIAQKVTTSETATIYADTKMIEIAPFFVSTEATSGQLYSVLFSLEGEESKNFTDSAFVTVSIPVGSADTGSVIPFIPVDSVFQTQSEAYVYVVEGNKAKSKPITLGAVTGKYVAVVEGLSSDEQIILTRTVIDGDSIKVTN